MARAAHGRRARAVRQGRAALSLRISRAARRADAISLEHAQRLEHQPVPLPQPWRRLRPRAGRNAGSFPGDEAIQAIPEKSRLPVRRGDAQPRIQAVPGLMASRHPLFPEKLARYIVKHSVREAGVLRELREATASNPHAGMQIGADQGQFMALLVQAIGAKRCLEIGTFTGYSALAVALALPADGRVLCCDINAEWTALARRLEEGRRRAQDRAAACTGARDAGEARGTVRFRFYRCRQGELPELLRALARAAAPRRADRGGQHAV